MVDLRRKRYWIGIAVIAALILLGFAFVFLLDPEPEPDQVQLPVQREQPAPPEEGVPPEQPVEEEQQETEAPEQGEMKQPVLRRFVMEQADEFVREMSEEISNHPRLQRWLGEQQITERFVTAVDNVARGKSPAEILPFLTPPTEFVEEDSGKNIVLFTPKSGSRYDLFLDVFESLDAEALARLYTSMEPTLQQIYEEQGYPEGDFSNTLKRAILELLQTPRVIGPVYLEKKVLSYGYWDEELENLSDAQKHVVRMGPVNAARFQIKLRQIAEAIGMDRDTLPQPMTYRPMTPPSDLVENPASAPPE